MKNYLRIEKEWDWVSPFYCFEFFNLVHKIKSIYERNRFFFFRKLQLFLLQIETLLVRKRSEWKISKINPIAIRNTVWWEIIHVKLEKPTGFLRHYFFFLVEHSKLAEQAFFLSKTIEVREMFTWQTVQFSFTRR